jgi:hypothetical protein
MKAADNVYCLINKRESSNANSVHCVVIHKTRILCYSLHFVDILHKWPFKFPQNICLIYAQAVNIPIAMFSVIRFFSVCLTPLLMFEINLPYHYTYINSCSVPKCYSCSICERTARRVTPLTASSGREWNILISYGYWSDCGKGFGLVCTAKKGLNVMTTEGRKGESLSAVIPTTVRIISVASI